MSPTYTAVDAVGQKTRLTLGKCIGRGGGGSVYRVNGRNLQGRRVAKLFHKIDTTTQRKIRAMIAAPPAGLEIGYHGERIPQYAWPTALVRADDGQQDVGYLMPYIATDKAVPLVQCLLEAGRHQHGMDALDALPNKLYLLRNLSALISELHRHGHYFFDLKPDNIVVYKDSMIVALLDCDGFSIATSDRGRIPAALTTPEYRAPEAIKDFDNTHGAHQDRFALAVILFQLLNKGNHPFQFIQDDSYAGPDAPDTDTKVAEGLYAYADPPVRSDIHPRQNSVHRLWPAELLDQFTQAFTSPPRSRPTAKDWRELLSRYIGESKTAPLERCTNYPNAASHIHFGYGCLVCGPQVTTQSSHMKGTTNGHQAKSNKPQCAAYTSDGVRCKNTATAGAFCRIHAARSSQQTGSNQKNQTQSRRSFGQMGIGGHLKRVAQKYLPDGYTILVWVDEIIDFVISGRILKFMVSGRTKDWGDRLVGFAVPFFVPLIFSFFIFGNDPWPWNFILVTFLPASVLGFVYGWSVISLSALGVVFGLVAAFFVAWVIGLEDAFQLWVAVSAMSIGGVLGFFVGVNDHYQKCK